MQAPNLATLQSSNLEADSYGTPLAPPEVEAFNPDTPEVFEAQEVQPEKLNDNRFFFPPSPTPTVQAQSQRLTQPNNDGAYFDPNLSTTTTLGPRILDKEFLFSSSPSPRRLFPPKQYISTMYRIAEPTLSISGLPSPPETLLLLEQHSRNNFLNSVPAFIRNEEDFDDLLPLGSEGETVRVASTPTTTASSTTTTTTATPTTSPTSSTRPRRFSRLRLIKRPNQVKRRRRKDKDFVAEELGVLSALTQSVMDRQVEEIIDHDIVPDNGGDIDEDELHKFAFFHVPDKNVYGFSHVSFDSPQTFSYQGQSTSLIDPEEAPLLPQIIMTVESTENPDPIFRVGYEYRQGTTESSTTTTTTTTTTTANKNQDQEEHIDNDDIETDDPDLTVEVVTPAVSSNDLRF